MPITLNNNYKVKTVEIGLEVESKDKYDNIFAQQNTDNTITVLLRLGNLQCNNNNIDGICPKKIFYLLIQKFKMNQ